MLPRPRHVFRPKGCFLTRTYLTSAIAASAFRVAAALAASLILAAATVALAVSWQAMVEEQCLELSGTLGDEDRQNLRRNPRLGIGSN